MRFFVKKISMKVKIISFAILSLIMLFNADVSAQRRRQPVRVLLVTGGHDFDREPFDRFLNSLPGISVTEVKHPDALAMFRPENRESFDVVLFYDMPQRIDEQEKKDFIDCLNVGKGIVVWHHAYCSYQDWPEYQNIIGGRYHETPRIDNSGVSHSASTFKYNVRIRAKVADKKHPVTKGIKDFEIVDEAYGNGVVNQNVHVLLTTDEPLSTPSIAWANKYGNSKVVTILLGHDNQAWSNPSLKKLMTQAILWVK